MKPRLYTLFFLLISGMLSAQNPTQDNSSFITLSADRLVEYTFIGIAVLLLIIILLLSRFYAKMLQMTLDKYPQEGYKKGAFSMLLFMPALDQSPFLQITANLNNTTFMFIVGIIAVELLVILYLINNINKLMQSKTELQEKARKADSAQSLVGTWTAALWHRMNRSVAVEKESDILRHHEFDGIRELDNDLPPWWVWGFYLTIIFAVVYLWQYHVSQSAPLQEQELQISLVRAEEQIRAYRATAANLIDESNVEYNTDPAWLERGAQVYSQNCVACHGANGEGGVGPNMTDDYFIHGGDIQTIFSIVKNGVLEKGMTPWKDLLSPSQMAQVASYIKSMQGTNIPNGKAPQGELYTEPEASDAEDVDATQQSASSDSL